VTLGVLTLLALTGSVAGPNCSWSEYIQCVGKDSETLDRLQSLYGCCSCYKSSKECCLVQRKWHAWARQFLCGELILAAVAAAWKFLRAPPPKADNAIPFFPFTVQH